MAQKLPRPEHCLNCGEKTTGNYCPSCGQKNTVRRVSLWLLFTEFVNDNLGFDSKFVKTIVYLVARPGFLTAQYNSGKRVAYIKPLRIYVTVSLLYFFVLALSISSLDVDLGERGRNMKLAEIGEALTDSIVTMVSDSLQTGNDVVTLDLSRFRKLALEAADSLSTRAAGIPSMEDLIQDTTVHVTVFGMRDEEIIGVMDRMRAARDDTASSFLRSKAAGLFVEKYDSMKGMTPQEFMEALKASFKRNMPKMMFFLLPVFALILKIIYPFSKRFYVEHLIFSLHFHAFLFLFLTVVLVAKADFLSRLAPYVILIYLYIAMRTAYRQSFARTAMKFTGLIFIYMLAMGVAIGGTLLVSIMLI